MVFAQTLHSTPTLFHTLSLNMALERNESKPSDGTQKQEKVSSTRVWIAQQQ